MAPFIFTFSSLLWMLLSFVSSVLVFITVNSTLWIIGNTPYNLPAKGCHDLNVTRYPSIGFNSMCIYHEEDEMCTSFVTDGLNTDSEIFPTLWKISHIIYISGFCISAIATLMSISTCRFQILFNKNIHNATGCLQALAGLLLLIALVFYMSGWKNTMVNQLCGPTAGPFNVGHCSLGIAFYYDILAIILIFIAACISSLAHRSTISYRVTKRVHAGRKCVCVC